MREEGLLSGRIDAEEAAFEAGLRPKRMDDFVGQDDLKERLANRNITIEIKSKAENYLAQKGFDPVFGARPIKRLIQREMENVLAKQLISGEVKRGEKIIVDSDGKQIIFI